MSRGHDNQERGNADSRARDEGKRLQGKREEKRHYYICKTFSYPCIPEQFYLQLNSTHVQETKTSNLKTKEERKRKKHTINLLYPCKAKIFQFFFTYPTTKSGPHQTRETANASRRSSTWNKKKEFFLINLKKAI